MASIKDLIDIATRVAGIFALLIIAIPKLTELVLGRYLTGSIERQKQELQMEVERLKGELSKSLETHKAQLQQAQTEDQRRYAENYSRTNEVSQHLIDKMNSLLVDIRDTLGELSDPPTSAYKQISALLGDGDRDILYSSCQANFH